MEIRRQLVLLLTLRETTVNTKLFLEEEQCLRFTLLVSEVALGLGAVLAERLLPQNYQGVFQKVATLLRNIVRDGYNTPYGAQEEGVSDEVLWFTNLAMCYPEIHHCFATYEMIDGIADTLEHLAKDESRIDSYSDEWIISVQEFFATIWVAINNECSVEGVMININPAIFPDVSTRLQ